MIKYKYTALKDNKIFVDGEIEASDLREAREKIRTLGFIPTKVYTEEYVEPKNTSINNSYIVHHLSLSQKISLTSELQTYFSAGIPILDTLHNIKTNSFDKKIKEICSNVEKTIMSGYTFAQSLKILYQKVFGDIYISLVQTGEQSGKLDITMERMLTLLKKQESVRDRIIKASIYPICLLVMMFGLLILFAKFVFPAFVNFIPYNELPIFAKSIMGFMNFADHYWFLIIILFGAVTAGFVSLFKNPKFKSKLDNFVLKIPVFSDFIKSINLSNFFTIMYITYETGLPIHKGMELANSSVGNSKIKSRIDNSIRYAQSGKTLTESFQISGVIPDALISMVSAGEKSGTLGKMLNDASTVIDKKVDMTIEALSRLFEPTVMVIIGIAVLIIAIAFYQAYFGMLGSLF